MPITVESLKAILDTKFHGVLKAGKHEQNGECCALELISVAKGVYWTDSPIAVGSWDLRLINDIDVSEEIRTKYLLPVIAVYAEAASWPLNRQKRVATTLAIKIVNVLIGNLPALPLPIAEQCRTASTLATAWAAMRAAGKAEARKNIFIAACQLWIEAAQQ